MSLKKLDDGYVLISEQSDVDAQLVSYLDQYLANHLSQYQTQQHVIVGIMARQLPQIGAYYKFYYQMPDIAFVVTVFVNQNSQETVYDIMGIDQLSYRRNVEYLSIAGCQLQIGSRCYDCMD